MTTLVEAMTFAEAALGRGLTDEEILLVGRMVEAGKDGADILAMLDKQIEVPDEDEDVVVYRYEARGDKVVRIPDADVPEDVQ